MLHNTYFSVLQLNMLISIMYVFTKLFLYRHVMHQQGNPQILYQTVHYRCGCHCFSNLQEKTPFTVKLRNKTNFNIYYRAQF